MMHLKNFSSLQARSFILINLSLLFMFTAIANAQSGRKIPKTPPKPPETSQPKETPPEENKPAKEQTKEPQTKIVVVYQLQSIYNSHYYSDFVAHGCLDRLQKSLSASVSFGREMNRKEATDLAKASSDVYVVWFQLESDSFGPDTNTGRENIQSMYVNYSLFAPTTGKSQTSGHVYQNQRGVLSRPLPQNSISAEYLLRKAGNELADRILKSMNLPVPPNYD
jgi:hypothetical protein